MISDSAAVLPRLSCRSSFVSFTHVTSFLRPDMYIEAQEKLFSRYPYTVKPVHFIAQSEEVLRLFAAITSA